MKKLLLCSLFLLFACVAFAQNDKLLVGKWNFVDIIPPTEALKMMTSEQKKQTKVMTKKIAEKSYFEFTKDLQFISLMDVGFGGADPVTTTYELLQKNTVLHVFPKEVEGTNGKQAVKDMNMKIEKLTKTELVLAGTDSENKGMKMIFKKAK